MAQAAQRRIEAQDSGPPPRTVPYPAPKGSVATPNPGNLGGLIERVRLLPNHSNVILERARLGSSMREILKLEGPEGLKLAMAAEMRRVMEENREIYEAAGWML